MALNAISKLIILLFVACSFSTCHDNNFNTNHELSLDYYEKLSDKAYRFTKWKINENIGQIIKNDHDTISSDYYARSHYLGTQTLIWVTRNGVTPQADTLLTYINSVKSIGFSPERFFASQIEKDLERMRRMNFDVINDINTVAVRLDYNLTKAYLRYVMGQRYGFINPSKVFNRLDRDTEDTVNVRFRHLYDVQTQHLGEAGYVQLLQKIPKDSVAPYLRDVEPKDVLYKRLKSMLPYSEGADRDRILVNMERCRWRQNDYPYNHNKYVVVNIPSYELIAVDGNDVQEMKVVNGNIKTKTPLLNSHITRMDINPKWIIPQSIVRKDIAAHAGNVDYFHSRNYYITERKTGQRIDPSIVSYDALRSGVYRVTQEGGEGNVLGRIIFRFANNFAIYLHDTSTRSAFGRENRSVSHGCIRVERPYDLAEFLLSDKSEVLLDKLRYSMSVNTHDKVDDEGNIISPQIDKSRLIYSVKIDPQIPVFITYQTIYQMPDGQIRHYNDVYGYDNVILQRINSFR